MNPTLLPPRSLDEMRKRDVQPVSDEILTAAKAIVDRVRTGGSQGLASCIEEFEGRSPSPLRFGRPELEAAFRRLPEDTQALLRRTAARIAAFAEGQRACLQSFETPIPGGRAGHDVSPMERAGCYAPGGRFPLPSSVLMLSLIHI